MKDYARQAEEALNRTEKLKNDPDYRLEKLKLDIAEDMCKFIKTQNINRADLAERYGTSRAYITKMLKGNCNFTLESMEKISSALGCELSIKFVPKGFQISHLYIEVEKTRPEISFSSLKKLGKFNTKTTKKKSKQGHLDENESYNAA